MIHESDMFENYEYELQFSCGDLNVMIYLTYISSGHICIVLCVLFRCYVSDGLQTPALDVSVQSPVVTLATVSPYTWCLCLCVGPRASVEDTIHWYIPCHTLCNQA